ncbi:ABC transporter permease [Egicoccus halophilus]|uniref:ABC transporter substrate-binding protein n=1 Tax=Egicoccus halophilus TaxID=1670830 RepID=A0A8J3AGM0_9ACTN|nr:ABC transporter permease [Egicoccus halophilus]GGI08516.1 ABC transporter substrate-binding protein [Egicoccus halophilus]
MLRIALASSWQHRRRLLGTALAVVLGTAFLVGTLVLSDTIRASFRTVFTDVNAGIDAVVRGEPLAEGASSRRALVDAALVDELAALDRVGSVAPEVEALAQVVGADGTSIGGDGPPTLGVNWIEDPVLAPYELVEGRAPTAAGEVVIDVDTAEVGQLSVGDVAVVRTPAPIEVEVVGLLTPRGGSGAGVTITAFPTAEAQRLLLGDEDRVTRILLAADGGDDQQLVDRITPVLPDGVEAVTGTVYTNEALDDLGRSFLDFFEAFLLVFAAIALLVATFSIYNTFSITVAQRLRESALLRALGASRRQVLASVLLEALLTGLVAAVLGLGLGIALAAGLLGLLGLLGQFGLPVEGAGLEVGARSVGAAFAVGVGITLLASLLPAVRASRVAPLAALREVSVDRSDQSRGRRWAGLAALAVGAVFVVLALTGEDGALRRAAVGAVGVSIGVFLLGPVTARPLAGVIGGPIRRLRGVTGGLAHRNAVRNPGRTASTSSALMVGVGIVTLFTVVAASINATIDEAVRGGFGGDLVIQGGGFSGAGISPQLVTEVDALPQVDRAFGVGFGQGLVDGEERTYSVVDPDAVTGVLDLELVAGSLADLGDDGLAVDEQSARERGWELGDAVELDLLTGTVLELHVRALFEAGPGDAVGALIVPLEPVAAAVPQLAYVSAFVLLADGVGIPEGQAAVEQVAAEHGRPEVLDRDAYAEQATGDVDQLLGIVYVLLALAIVIALMGITNTLSLSVHERTREIGLLRALGQTRSQLRAMVRWESVIVALFGTATGLVLGTFLGWVFIRAIAAEEGIGTFAAPLGPLSLVVALGALVGIVAALRPARRAARLDVLTAIATE